MDKKHGWNNPPALPAYADSFLNALMAKPGTILTYRYALRRLSDFMSVAGIRADRPLDWSDDLLVRFNKWLLRTGRKSPTCAIYMCATHKFLRWLATDDRLAKSFSIDKAFSRWYIARGGRRYGARAAVRKPDPNLPRIVTFYDALTLPDRNEPHARLKRLEILRARAVVHTLYASAGRASEVASLTREMVRDGRASEFLITGKGDRERVMLLTKEAQSAIAAYCKERGADKYPYLFVSYGRGAGKPIGRGTIWSIVKIAAHELGMGQGASPHAFRHYRAQQLLDDGMAIEVLQAFLGHADISLTRRVYAPETPRAKLRKQVELFGKSASEAAADLEHAEK